MATAIKAIPTLRGKEAKEFLRQKVAFLASVVEIAISALVLIAIFLTGFRVVGELSGLLQDPDRLLQGLI